MTVYDRAYRGYSGDLTGNLQRPLVITRYAIADCFSSRLFTAFFVLSYVPSLIFLVALYLRYNVEAMVHMGISPGELFAIDKEFFALYWQRPAALLAFAVVIFVGPALVSPDLRNNSMPLYLSRPVTKVDYIAGKLLAIIALTWGVTLAPGIFLFLTQAYFAESGWLADNFRILPAMIVTSFVWTVCLGMIALAVSSVVKWRPVARIAFLGFFFVSSAIGTLMREGIFGDWRGGLANLFDAHEALLASLYGVSNYAAMPTWWLPWVVFGLVTLLAGRVVWKRIQAYEIA